MYQPRYFKQENQQQILAFIDEYPMASIATMTSKGLLGNHIPMILVKRDDKTYLQGHVARANSIHKDIDDSIDVLAMFQGPNGYVSPSWYPSKKKDPRTVPTWDYVAVHVSGKIRFFNDKNWLKKHLTSLSDINEKKIKETWKISDAPDDYISTMLKAIVGIEIEISKITGNTKMHQNHARENRNGVIAGLKALDNNNLANWVKNPNPYK